MWKTSGKICSYGRYCLKRSFPYRPINIDLTWALFEETFLSEHPINILPHISTVWSEFSPNRPFTFYITYKHILKRSFHHCTTHEYYSKRSFSEQQISFLTLHLGQGCVNERLKSSLRKFYGRYEDLTNQYEIPLSRMLHDILDDDHIQWHPPLIRHYTNCWTLLMWTLLPNLTFFT